MNAGETSNQTMKNNNQNQSAAIKIDPTTQFLSSLVTTKVSKNAARLKLARKTMERSRILKKKRKQKERMREMVKKLKTTEAELLVVDETIKVLQQEINAGTDDE